MAWWSGLGAGVKGLLAKGVDLVLARLIRIQGALTGVELEIQRRVPETPTPGQLSLLGHVAAAAEAAAEVEREPSRVFDDLERIPVNELLAERVEPGDRFIYSTDWEYARGVDIPMTARRVDVTSPIPLSFNEIEGFVADEVDQQDEDSPPYIPPDKPGESGTPPSATPSVRVNAVVRVY